MCAHSQLSLIERAREEAGCSPLPQGQHLILEPFARWMFGFRAFSNITAYLCGSSWTLTHFHLAARDLRGMCDKLEQLSPRRDFHSPLNPLNISLEAWAPPSPSERYPALQNVTRMPCAAAGASTGAYRTSRGLTTSCTAVGKSQLHFLWDWVWELLVNHQPRLVVCVQKQLDVLSVRVSLDVQIVWIDSVKVCTRYYVRSIVACRILYKLFLHIFKYAFKLNDCINLFKQ